MGYQGRLLVRQQKWERPNRYFTQSPAAGDSAGWAGRRGHAALNCWTRELSLQASCGPKWLTGANFPLGVLNLFNARGVTQVIAAGENPLRTPSPNYPQPGAFQAGRSFRFMAQYEF